MTVASEPGKGSVFTVRLPGGVPNNKDATVAPAARLVWRFLDGPRQPGNDEFAVAAGWYWWSCSPGCLPDSEPAGPFETEAKALADAREGMD